MAAGNRDPERFPDPDRLDFDAARTTGTWRSAGPRTSASARRWRGWRPRSVRDAADAACPDLQLTEAAAGVAGEPRPAGAHVPAADLHGPVSGDRRTATPRRPRRRPRGCARRASRTTRRSTDLESSFFPDSLPAADRRRSLFEDNPLWPRLRDSWPVGWVLEDDDGRIVGIGHQRPVGVPVRTGRSCSAATGTAGRCCRSLPRLRDDADGRVLQPGAARTCSSARRSGPTPPRSGAPTPAASPSATGPRAAYAITRYRAFARAALSRKGVPLAGALAPPAAAALRLKDALTPKALPDGPPVLRVLPSSTASTRGSTRSGASWSSRTRPTLLGRARRRVSAVALRRSRCGRAGCGSSPRCAAV